MNSGLNSHLCMPCGNVGICCVTACVPCYTAGKNFEKYKKGECLYAGLMSWVPCLGDYIRFVTRRAAIKKAGGSEVAFLSFLWTNSCFCCFHCCSDIQIRREYTSKCITFDKEEISAQQIHRI